MRHPEFFGPELSSPDNSNSIISRRVISRRFSQNTRRFSLIVEYTCRFYVKEYSTFCENLRVFCENLREITLREITLRETTSKNRNPESWLSSKFGITHVFASAGVLKQFLVIFFKSLPDNLLWPTGYGYQQQSRSRFFLSVRIDQVRRSIMRCCLKCLSDGSIDF